MSPSTLFLSHSCKSTHTCSCVCLSCSGFLYFPFSVLSSYESQFRWTDSVERKQWEQLCEWWTTPHKRLLSTVSPYIPSLLVFFPSLSLSLSTISHSLFRLYTHFSIPPSICPPPIRGFCLHSNSCYLRKLPQNLSYVWGSACPFSTKSFEAERKTISLSYHKFIQSWTNVSFREKKYLE